MTNLQDEEVLDEEVEDAEKVKDEDEVLDEEIDDSEEDTDDEDE